MPETTSDTLSQTQIQIFSQSHCNTTRRAHSLIPDLFQSSIMCAGYQSGEDSSCPGDSGGPLTIFKSNENRHVQVGVLSGGKCQSNLPGVYGRIEDYDVFEFINKIAFYEKSMYCHIRKCIFT